MIGSLRRSLGLLDVVSLGINAVIGSGIFLLPGLVAETLGPAAIGATLFAGLLCFLIALCFAEMASRHTGTGGAYLYAQQAFGGLIGFEVGWMTWAVRIIGWAALINAFTVAASHFFPALAGGWPHTALIIVTMTLLGLVNLRGVKAGAILTNVATIAKLLPMVAFVLIGVFFIEGERFTPFAPYGASGFGAGTLKILFAYVGFEAIVVPAGEMKDPRRSVPIALLIVMGLVTAVYLGIQAVAIGTYDGLVGSPNPVAEASRTFMGDIGAVAIGAGIVISILGVNAATALITPRCGYALAEQGHLPERLGWVHPNYGTPVVAVAVSTVLSMALAVTGSFEDLLVVSVLARFVQYVPTCVAVLVIRYRTQTRAEFAIPGGPLVPVTAVTLSVWLVSQAEAHQLIGGGVAMLLGLPLYFVSAQRRAQRGAPKQV